MPLRQTRALFARQALVEPRAWRVSLAGRLRTAVSQRGLGRGRPRVYRLQAAGRLYRHYPGPSVSDTVARQALRARAVAKTRRTTPRHHLRTCETRARCLRTLRRHVCFRGAWREPRTHPCMRWPGLGAADAGASGGGAADSRRRRRHGWCVLHATCLLGHEACQLWRMRTDATRSR